MSGSVTSTNAINTGTGATITLNGNPSSLPLALVSSSPYDYSFSTQLELVKGNNTITVTATDSQNHSGSATVTVSALIPIIGIRAELTWNTDGTDLDSHLIAPCYAMWDSFGDCYYWNKNPDWGGSSASNPSLDQDVTTGYGPEYIVLQSPPFDGVYQYKVHYYSDHETGLLSTATVRIWVNDNLVFQGNRTMSSGQVWDCANINWPSGTVTAGDSRPSLTVTSSGCCPILVQGLSCGNMTVPAGGTTIFSAPQNTEVTLTAQTAEGECGFDSWTLDGNELDSGSVIPVTMDTDHTAVATCVPLYTLSVTNDGCMPVSVSGFDAVPQGANATFVLSEGTEVTLQAYGGEGIAFTGWYVDSAGSPLLNNTLEITMDTDHQVTAVCVTAYTLSVQPQYGHIIVSWPGIPGGPQECGVNESYGFDVPAGTVVTLEAEPEVDYYFYYWLINGEIVYGNPGNLTMDRSYSVRDVRRTQLPSTLSVTSNGCCPITVSGLPDIDGAVEIPAGGNSAFLCDPSRSVTLQAQGGDFCSFDHWTIDDVTYEYNPIQVPMDENHTATLECSANLYVNPGESIQAAIDAAAAAGGGTVHVAAGTYHELITLRSAVVVRGAGAGTTTIDGSGDGTVVTASGVDSTARLEDFTISHGSSSSGGGMYNLNSSPTVTNCTFSDNSASNGGGMYNWLSSSPVVTNCTISSNSATGGGGILCDSSSSPTITNCVINSNSASWSGGGIECDNSSSATIRNCIISHNSSNYGGGMQCNQSSPMIINCIISDNTSTNGGAGINNDDASSTVINCTITGNTGPGGGLHSGDTSSSVTAVNCIIWGNTPEVSVNPTCHLYITYSDVRGGYDGEGNINADPLFISESDFHLQNEPPNQSLCIDAGDNSAVSGITTDLDGNPRIVDSDGNGTATVDMGAYEADPLPFEQTYTAVNDFSTENGNPNGVWSYAWMPTDFSSFNLYTNHNSYQWYGWGSDNSPCIWLNTGALAYGVPTGWLSLHPGNGYQPSVLRWTAPVAGTVRVTGQFLSGDSGYMEVAVRLDNQSWWNAGDSGTFDLTTNVASGTTIDFAVYGGYGFGNTPISATISYQS